MIDSVSISIIIRFIIIFLMAFIFGLERQLSNKPIGFGTFIFVATGSCSLGIVSSVISPNNMLAIIGGVVTGIGFLGAGALIKTTDKIFGFTTAASIWIFSIIGLIIGVGQYLIGTLTYLTVWVVIIVDRVLETEGIGSYKRKIIIKTKKIVQKKEVTPIFRDFKWRLISFEEDKKSKKSTIVYLVNMPRSYVNVLKEQLESMSWVEGFKIE